MVGGDPEAGGRGQARLQGGPPCLHVEFVDQAGEQRSGVGCHADNW